jgi:hypothetical protein
VAWLGTVLFRCRTCHGSSTVCHANILKQGLVRHCACAHRKLKKVGHVFDCIQERHAWGENRQPKHVVLHDTRAIRKGCDGPFPGDSRRLFQVHVHLESIRIAQRHIGRSAPVEMPSTSSHVGAARCPDVELNVDRSPQGSFRGKAAKRVASGRSLAPAQSKGSC